MGISDTLTRLDGKPLHNLETINNVLEPYAPKAYPVTIEAPNPIVVTGWAVDSETRQLAGAVEVVFDGRPLQADYKISRQDVAIAQKIDAYALAGFRLVIPTAKLAKGDHTLSVRVVANNLKSYREGSAITVSLR